MAAAVYRDATNAVGAGLKALGVGAKPGTKGPQRSDSSSEGRGSGRDPILSRYACNAGVGSNQPLGQSQVLAQLGAAAATGDKASKAAVASALRLLFFFECLTPETAAALGGLLGSQGSDMHLARPLSYLAGLHLSGTSAGTPTVYDPAALSVPKAAADKTRAAVHEYCTSVLNQNGSGLDPGLQRATLWLLASAARGGPASRAALLAAVNVAIAAADDAAAAAAPGSGTAPPPAASDWALQHGVFGAVRAAGAATGTDAISRAAFVGLGSPDPVGARHALALATLVAAREPSSVALEMGPAVAEAAETYAEANGGNSGAAGGDAGAGGVDSGTASSPANHESNSTPAINLADPFARLELARLCSRVVHSDARGSDVGRDGAPFWRMLVLLATRDAADLVRFGALEALAGGPASGGPLAAGGGARSAGSSRAAQPTTLPTTLPLRGSVGGGPGSAVPDDAASGSSRPTGRTSRDAQREAALRRQRSTRAWRLLCSRAAEPALIPGLPAGKGRMPLGEAVGALLALALRKADDAPRRRVALGVVVSLAEGCLAADGASAGNVAGSGPTPLGMYAMAQGAAARGAAPADKGRAELTRVMTTLSVELAALLESKLSGPERCAALQAALLVQAANLGPGVSPAKIEQAGASVGWTPALQALLNGTVLDCALARPGEAGTYLEHAHAVVRMAPGACDLDELQALWDAAAAGAGAGSVPAASRHAARDGTVGAVLALLSAPPPASARGVPGAEPGSVASAARQAEGWSGVKAAAAAWLGERGAALYGATAGAPPRASAMRALHRISRPDAGELAPLSTANPGLAAVVAGLGRAAEVEVWEVRCAAARAMATLAVRAGEPARGSCYAALSGLTTRPGDALGLASLARPALALLDRVYGSLAVVDAMFAKHAGGADGGDADGDADEGESEEDAHSRASVSDVDKPSGDDDDERLPYDVTAWPASDALAVALRCARLRAEAEAGVCSLPRSGYCILGHRVARLLAAHPATASGAAAFLDAQVGGDAGTRAGGAASDVTGSELVEARASEVDAILGGGEGADGAAAAEFGGFASSDFGRGLADKDREVEDLLSGKSTTKKPSPWGSGGLSADFVGPSASGFGSNPLPSMPEGDEEDAGAADPSSPGGAWAAGGGAAREPERAESMRRDSSRTAPAARTAQVAHMFVGDYTQPDELSVFEGDTVTVLEESEGWVMVRDASGAEGLVPLSYLTLNDPPARIGTGGRGAGVDRRSTGSFTDQASPRLVRGGSGGLVSPRFAVTNNEALLDDMFAGGAGVPEPFAVAGGPVASGGYDFGTAAGVGGDSSLAAVPATTAAGAALGAAGSFDEDTSLLGGGYSAPPPPDAARRGASPGFAASGRRRFGSGDWGGLLGSVGAASGGTGSGTATPASARHQRTMSGGHRRTLSGGSGSRLGGGSSLPDTPPRGPSAQEGFKYEEQGDGAVMGRPVVAEFRAEMDGELTVGPGDQVLVHSDIDGWARVVRVSDGRSGLVPSWAVGGEA